MNESQFTEAIKVFPVSVGEIDQLFSAITAIKRTILLEEENNG